MTAQPDSPFLRAALIELLLVVGVDEGLLEIIAPASVGGEGSGDDQKNLLDTRHLDLRNPTPKIQ